MLRKMTSSPTSGIKNLSIDDNKLKIIRNYDEKICVLNKQLTNICYFSL